MNGPSYLRPTTNLLHLRLLLLKQRQNLGRVGCRQTLSDNGSARDRWFQTLVLGITLCQGMQRGLRLWSFKPDNDTSLLVKA